MVIGALMMVIGAFTLEACFYKLLNAWCMYLIDLWRIYNQWHQKDNVHFEQSLIGKTLQPTDPRRSSYRIPLTILYWNDQNSSV